jgi:hypothetical protein
MPGFAFLPLRVALVAGLLLAAGASAVLAQERAGVNSAVNPEATGTPPGATVRRLVIGQDVVFNERITTAETGQTQLLFLDESSMSVGPNSDLTIDQFVYDPKSGTGKLAMSATRGLLRYVGGKLSKQDEAVTLRTSTATLAVRGGAFIAQIAPGGTTDAVFLYGKGLTVNGLAGGSQTLTRPGFQSITTPGGSPSPPAPQPPGQLTLFTQQLDGHAGGTGGAANIPTDTHVVNSGVTQTISGNLSQSFQQSQQHQGGTQFTPQPTTDTASAQMTINPQPNSAGQIIDCISLGTCNSTNTVQAGTSTSGQQVGGPSSNIVFPTSVADINVLRGTAFIGTYTGNAIGSVVASGVTVPASGGFIGTYNFGTQNGTVAVNNFAGQNFAASGSAPLTGANYAYTVTQPGLTGSMNGTFFGPKAAETAGNFAVQTTFGPPLRASGTFAGKR